MKILLIRFDNFPGCFLFAGGGGGGVYKSKGSACVKSDFLKIAKNVFLSIRYHSYDLHHSVTVCNLFNRMNFEEGAKSWLHYLLRDKMSASIGN